MKILLFNPPFYRFIGLEQDYVPLSLLAVGSQLVKEGHGVLLKNFEVCSSLKYEGYSDRTSNFNRYINGLESDNEIWREVYDTIDRYKPDKIGISVLSVKYKSALKIIDIAKKFKIPCFVGGPHVNTNPKDFDDSIIKYTYEFESRNTHKRIKDLDGLPLSNFDMLLDEYSPNGYSHIVSSRGCPFHCRFCASNTIWKNKVTFKSAKRILDEMRTIKNRFNSSEFIFWDETFTANKKRLVDFCKLYDVDATWNCDTRADSLDENTVINMKNSGCKHMSLGIESGRQAILDYIGKGEKIEDFIKISEILNKHNIQWKAYCIIGFPEETEEDIFYTIDFIKSLKPFRITLSFFTPYKDTSLFDECLDKGLIDKNYDATMFAHQSPNNYFCPKIHKSRYDEIKKIVSNDVDVYNKTAIESWR